MSRQQWTGAQVDDETVFVTGNDAAFNDIYDLDVVDGRQELQGNEAW